ncbi:hypothetical protein [Schinkia azotoformans]|uniref:hypothetical protein n=1 Tax=Schinkia azotoformans TaxID=1454 RepID=UPI002DB8ED44|nr:hypothetical protein [Schinkia azotoformans]MEC1715933.1 hypothetical protein [Schinkia azotoformans]MEC1740114.1 hypothetical protein [Schinkia azotoformans]MEC1744566.1 hypothetical protein [Schinkia azotoformans]MEC1756274.1 hypothetical protein [Schinkia azotoformans]MEC1769153.1 hypothetical protein [Schinkia azotoformans]
MRVEFFNADGGGDLFTIQKDDVTSFVKLLKSMDKINICFDTGDYILGTLDELIYEVIFDEQDNPIEILKVYIYDFRDRLRDQKNTNEE